MKTRKMIGALATAALGIMVLACWAGPDVWEPTVYGTYTNSATYTYDGPVGITVKQVLQRVTNTVTATAYAYRVSLVTQSSSLTNLLALQSVLAASNTPLNELNIPLFKGDKLLLEVSPAVVGTNHNYAIFLQGKQL